MKLKFEKIKTLQLKLTLTFAMATGITEEDIQKLIQDALAAQAYIHRTELPALAARFQNSSASAAPTTPAYPAATSTRSTVPRTRLNMGSPSLIYNGLGGTSTSAISQAAVHRHTSAVPVSTSTPEDFYNFSPWIKRKLKSL